MQTILLGKEGNQPFKIKARGVSRCHAQIIIDDSGNWTLEDLNSSNGTYIRREKDGTLLRVGRMNINPMTFICLGPDNSQGCSFYAKQVLPQNYNRFDEEYSYLLRKSNEFDAKQEKVDKKIKTFRWMTPAVNALVVGVTFPLQSLPAFSGANSMNLLNLMRGGSVLASLIPLLYDGGGSRKKIEKERERFMHCPNPLCDHKLRSADVKNYKCPKCRLPN